MDLSSSEDERELGEGILNLTQKEDTLAYCFGTWKTTSQVSYVGCEEMRKTVDNVVNFYRDIVPPSNSRIPSSSSLGLMHSK